MPEKVTPIKPGPSYSSVVVKDRELIRLHMIFDDLSELIQNKCYSTTQVKIALSLIKTTRQIVIRAFVQDFGGSDGN